MGDCSATCCRGWQINVDEKTYKKYLLEPGKDGRRLRAGIDKKDDVVTIKKRKGTCPFFTKEGKCCVQLAKGEDYLPEVCRVFPRYRINYGLFAEEMLFLSCPETVRLFIENIDNIYLITNEKEVDYELWFTNDDTDYLKELIQIQEDILSLFSDEDYTIGNINSVLRSFGKDLQISLVEFLEKPQLSDYLTNDSEFYFNAEMTDKLITGGMYHTRLRKVAPFLYNLFKLYFTTYDKLTASEADVHTRKIFRKLEKECPLSVKVIREYYKYYYMTEFMMVYEDYSILKRVYMGMIVTHFLKLFFALYYDKYGHLTKEDMVQIMTNYNRRAEHNDEVVYALYSVIEKEIISKEIDSEG